MVESMRLEITSEEELASESSVMGEFRVEADGLSHICVACRQ